MLVLKKILLATFVIIAFMQSSYANFNDLNYKTDAKKDEVMEQAKDLEAVLLSVMIEPMFPDGKDSDVFGGGHGSKVFRTMMIQEYGKVLSDAGGIGLAKNVAKKLR